MKDKKILTTIILLLILAIPTIILIVLAALNYNKTDDIKYKDYKNGIFYSLGHTYDNTSVDKILTREELKEYEQKLDLHTDFNTYNYLLFNIEYDSCRDKNLKPVRYKIKDNTISINVEYDQGCGVCAEINNKYLLQLDKSVDRIDKVNLEYTVKSEAYCDPTVAYKPMIYLYPQEETNVTVKLGNPYYLTTTYPKYNDSWNVIAEPDGTLKTNNREYYGLFWEGTNHQAKVKEDGFIVEGKDVEHFLEEKLDILGLTNKEANEFIIYWLPKLENNKYNYIRFETIEEVNEYMPLEITPNPDTIIRVLMDYKPLDKPINITEQKLTKTSRIGFSVVEWGGSLIK